METMNHQDIGAEVLRAERNLADAQRMYSRNPSEEARNDIRSASNSLRWWAIQLSHCQEQATRER